MKDKIKTSNITLIRIIKDENGENRGEAIFGDKSYDSSRIDSKRIKLKN